MANGMPRAQVAQPGQPPAPPASQPQGLSPFVALPNEIKLMIAQYLCPHCVDLGEAKTEAEDKVQESLGRSMKYALSGVSKTCKAWQAIAQPILFHETLWDIPEDSGKLMRQLPSILSTLVERPNLAKMVKTLGCPNAFFYGEGDVDEDLWKTRALRKLLKPLQNLATRDRRFKRFATLRFDDWPRALTLALLQCTPELQQLYIQTPALPSLPSGLDTTVDLRQLQRLAIDHRLNGYGFYRMALNLDGSPAFLDDFGDVFTFTPNLVDLILLNGHWTQFPSPPAPLLKLKSLMLYSYDLWEADIKKILEGCPNLEHIRYLPFSDPIQVPHNPAREPMTKDSFYRAICAVELPPLVDDSETPCLNRFTGVSDGHDQSGKRFVEVSRRRGTEVPTDARKSFWLQFQPRNT